MLFAKATAISGAVILAVSALERLAGTLGLIAGIAIALGIIVASGRSVWRFLRGLEQVVDNTKALPQFMEEQRKTNEHVRDKLREENARVAHQLQAAADRMSRIEGTLEALAMGERAAVRGALEAATTPRPPRSTDRTGWRE